MLLLLVSFQLFILQLKRAVGAISHAILYYGHIELVWSNIGKSESLSCVARPPAHSTNSLSHTQNIHSERQEGEKISVCSMGRDNTMKEINYLPKFSKKAI